MLEIRNKFVAMLDEFMKSSISDNSIFDTLTGKQLGLYRKHFKLSLRDVAIKTGVSHATVSRMEAGNETYLSHYTAICKFYKQKLLQNEESVYSKPMGEDTAK